jgi:glycosyltransferase involved in cell wall biosynthesis
MTTLPHICLVLPNIYPVLANRGGLKFVGGAELRHSIAARLWVRMGYRVSVVCLDHEQPEGEMIDGIRIIKAHTPDGGLPMLRFIYPRLIGMWCALKRADADIYYQPCAGYLTGVVAEFCRKHGKKSIFAGASDTDFTPDKLRIQYARDRWLYLRGLRNVDAITVQTERQRALCLERLGRNADLIPNAYDAPYALPDSRREYVLWVGGIRSVKRPDRFLEIARALPHVRFRMIGGPVGHDDDARVYYERIKAEAAGISNLEFLGFIPYAETEPHFDHASVFVNTSDVEGFPNTFLQAWARGVPTVSFFDPVLREEGIYRQVQRVEGAVEAVASLAKPSSERDALSARCRTYQQQYHSTESILPRYAQLFSRLTGMEATTTNGGAG